MNANTPETMNLIIATYIVYLLVSVALTVWVAKTLHKNGRIFLVDSFSGNEPLADSVNHLLLVGFYLMNIGYVTLALKYGVEIANAKEAVETFSTKIGLVLMVLGVMLLVTRRLNAGTFTGATRAAGKRIRLADFVGCGNLYGNTAVRDSGRSHPNVAADDDRTGA